MTSSLLLNQTTQVGYNGLSKVSSVVRCVKLIHDMICINMS